MTNPPFLAGLAIAVVVAVAALPSELPEDGGIQPATELPTQDSHNFQVPLDRQGANVFVDKRHGFDEMFEDAEKAPKKSGEDGSTAFMSEMEVLDDDAGAKAFMDAFAKLDKAAAKSDVYHARSKNPYGIVMEGKVSDGGVYENFVKNLAKPPSTPISDISPNTAAAVATSKRTADTTSLAFMRYKKSPFALKVVGKGKAAKLTLTNPDKFKKALEKIPKGWVKCANEGGKCKFKGTRQVRYGAKDSHGKDHFKIMTKTAGAAGTPCTSVVFGDPIKGTKKTCYYKAGGHTKWACSKEGRAMKATYDSAMKFWNHKAFEIYGKDCSKTGGRCAVAAKLIMPYTFKGVIGVKEPIPSDIATTWWAHKMDCMPIMKKVAPKHSGANGLATSSLTLVVAAVTMVLWTIQH